MGSTRTPEVDDRASTVAHGSDGLGSDSTAVATPSDGAADLIAPVAELPTVATASYQRGRALGAGGLGVVVEARDARLGRTVALKELRRESPASEARFVREALVTARLQHPGIVPIYEAGRWPGGAPFYAMKLVAGTSLAQAIASRASLAERLALLPALIAATEAIAYAHTEQVIHRDLKPHNIMLGEFGETLVIDWGLAKDLRASASGDGEPGSASGGDSASGDAGQTVAGSVLGTAGYMAPEQARGEPVTERADVYALGAVLHHLLAGTPPYAGAAPGAVAIRPAPLAELAPSAPRDLVAIVEQAMAIDPAQRYASARELVEDLRRFQTGQLVSVRDYGAAERLARLVRRHRGPAVVAALALVVLAVVGVVSVRRVVAERDVARRARATEQVARVDAEERRNALLRLQARSLLDVDPTAAVAWLAQLPADRLDLVSETIGADALSRGVARHVLRAHDASVRTLVVGPGGVAHSAGADGRVVRLDLGRGAAREVWRTELPVMALTQAPGKDQIAIGYTTGIELLEAGATRPFATTTSPVVTLAFSSDGADLVAGLIDGRALLWRGGVGPVELGRATQEMRDVAFSPDGTAVAGCSFDTSVWVWRVADHAELVRGRHDGGGIWDLAWSPDGRTLGTAGEDRTVRLWHLDGTATQILRHDDAATTIAFLRDGRIASGGRDNVVRVWRADGTPERVLAHGGDVLRVVASPDGRSWATAAIDKLVRVWDVDGGAPRILRGHEDFVSLLDFTPDGGALVSGGQDGSVRLWSTAPAGAPIARGAAVSTLTADRAAAIAISKDGVVSRIPLDGTPAVELARDATAGELDPVPDGRLLGVGLDGALTVWDAAGRATVLPPAGFQLGHAAALGDVIIGAGWDNNVWWWTGGAAPVAIPGHAQYVLGVLAIPAIDGFVSGGADGTMRLWDRAARVLHVLDGFRGPVHTMAISHDGTMVAGGDINGVVMVWRTDDGERLGRYEHRGFVRTLAWSPDGRWLASGGEDKEVHVWDARTGAARPLDGHLQSVSAVVFAHDGTLLASGSIDGSLRIWDLGTGAQQLLRGPGGPIQDVTFALDDAAFFAVVTDGTLWRWPRTAYTPLPLDPVAQRAVLEAATSATIGRDDRPTTVP